ncbi:MAG: M23 family metallopeptidase [Brevinematales bacterium]|nr:M23 family metallopeptidase [Brevinematales bacterium]
MNDYKHLFDKKWKRIHRDLNKTIKQIGRKRNKFALLNLIKYLKPELTFKISFLLSILVMCFVGGSFIFSSFNNEKKINDSSFIGKIKIDEELNGQGGPEVTAIEKQDSLKFYFYQIQKGDSLYTLSKKLGVSMDTIISLNKITDAHSLSEGNDILVPSLDGIIYTVKKDDTLEKIASSFKISVDDIRDANELEEEEIYEGRILFLPNAKLPESERMKVLDYYFLKPLRGRYTSGFGIRRDPFTGLKGYHTGIDIAKPTGTPVYASKDGVVKFAGWSGGYGLCIFIKHQFGYETVYGHLSSVNVKEGQTVKAGQFVGRVGNSGRSTGSHLHFEVRKFGKPLNPLRVSGLGKSRGGWY